MSYMSKITKAQYELALARVEELLPLVDEQGHSQTAMQWSSH